MTDPEVYIVQPGPPRKIPWKLPAGLGLLALFLGASLYFATHGWP